MTSSIESFDKAIISRQPNFNDRKTRSEFRKVIPNLKTVVVHCFDPRVTGGIPAAVAKALPGQIYPGEVFEFAGEDGKEISGRTPLSFRSWLPGAVHQPVRSYRLALRAISSISTMLPLFTTRTVAERTLRLRALSRPSRRNSDRTSPTCGMPTISASKTSRSRCIATCGMSVTRAERQGT